MNGNAGAKQDSFFKRIYFEIFKGLSVEYNYQVRLIITFFFQASMYFAVVAMTTVGLGDISPRTFAGRTLTVVWIVLRSVRCFADSNCRWTTINITLAQTSAKRTIFLG